ncbi:hypothetical protein ABEW61_04210 [Paenibacillus amylolyticus]|uniref:hypothetical protein n=1 Tax=Paenibacillus amylolyticus TaxID=1451 RepID=UPI003D26C20A
MEAVARAIGYHDKRKEIHRVHSFLTHAAAGEWASYRSGVDKAVHCRLPSVNYSTFSKKAADVPCEVFKHWFEIELPNAIALPGGNYGFLPPYCS